MNVRSLPWSAAPSLALLAFALVFGLVVTAPVRSQSSSRAALRPIPAPIKDAGTYHLGAGTWTRTSHVTLAIGPDVIYDNTCPTGYFGSQHTNETWTDEGRIPSTSGPASAPNDNVGCLDAYAINGFGIAYCADHATFACTIGFQEHYTSCSAPAPMHTFVLTGLPGSHGTLAACWTVAIDLTATSATFSMLADGTGTFAGTNASFFGWSFTTNSATSGASGPVIAGHFPTSPDGPCSGVDGTRWDTLPGAPPPTWPYNNMIPMPDYGTGMDTQDRFRVDGPTSFPNGAGCYFFNGNPLASLYLRLFSNTGCPPPQPGTDDCVPGVAGVMACPCGNPQLPPGSIRGCDNSSGTEGAILLSSGTPSLATDTLVFHAIDEKPTASSILLQGTTFTASGVAFGQGVRCASGNLKRLFVHMASGGSVTAPSGGDPSVSARSAALGDPIAAGSSREYLMYYRDPTVLGGCPSSSTFSATQGQSISWTP
jgi:hypothetical protein